MTGNEEKLLSQVSVRENAGRDTILRYRYQFRRAAEAALRMLEDDSLERVYCDFHDDYVLKIVENFASFYLFHQVKTKGRPSEQWARNDLFGVTKSQRPRKDTSAKKPKTGHLAKVKSDKFRKSIGGKLYLHHLNFGEQCKTIHIVTNAYFEVEIEILLEDIAGSGSVEDLVKKNGLGAILLEVISDECEVEGVEAFSFLRKLRLSPNSGILQDDGSEMGNFINRIYKYSEVSLSANEAHRITRSLIDLTEAKSMELLPKVVSEEELQKHSSIDLSDVLGVLSLSKDAYRELKESGDTKALKSVSLLGRLLGNSHASENMIMTACRAKIQWENWHRTKRHDISPIDLMSLERQVKLLVESHINRSKSFDETMEELSTIAKQFDGKIFNESESSKDLVFGHFWSLTVRENI